MSCFLNSFPDRIQTFKPTICCRLIANLSPNPLLKIQSRLITGQIFQMKLYVLLN